MHYSPILAPVVALVAWTLVMMLWMAVARLREFRRLGISSTNIPRGSRGVDLEGRPTRRGPVEVPQLQALDGAADDLLCDRADPRAHGFRRRHQLSGWPGAMSACASSTAWSRRRSTSSATASRIFALASLCLLGLTVHAGSRILHDCWDLTSG